MTKRDWTNRRRTRMTILILVLVALAAGGAAAIGNRSQDPAVTVVHATLGFLMTFIVTGYTLLESLRLPIKGVEKLLATTGLSLTIALCTACILAAVPLGISRQSFGLALSSITVVLAGFGAVKVGRRASSAVSQKSERTQEP